MSESSNVGLQSSKKRTKSNNFTAAEKRILTEMVLKYKNMIENKRTDAATNRDKLNGWIRLAQEFNSISTYCYRSHLVLKCCWENIKRQAKKEQAETKKKIFMTGGGKPPSPSPSTSGTGAIIETILGPALNGTPNIYDSDAITNETLEVKLSTENNERDLLEVVQILDEDTFNFELTEEKHENMAVRNDNKTVSIIAEDFKATPKGILKENNTNDNWCSWTPKNLKTPVSEALKVQNEETWLKRRRPKNDCPNDMLIQEKIKLVKILQDNAIKETAIRLSILEEQLAQEKLKTEKLRKDN